MTARQRWQARRTDTGEIVSAPYYAAAPAKRIAKSVARDERVPVEVLRNGRVWETVQPPR